MGTIQKSKVDEVGTAPDRYEMYKTKVSLSMINRMIYTAQNTGDSRLDTLRSERDKFVELLAEDVDELKPKAEQDQMTGVYNKTFFEECASQVYDRAKDGSLCVIMIDGDDFKQINDTHGHPVGDEVIRYIAKGTQKNLRGSDLLGRMGGEEFAVVLPNTDCDTGYKVAERIRSYFENNHPNGRDDITQTLSIGIACRDENSKKIDDLVNRADKALYQAKQDGKNRVVMYTGEDQ